MSIPAGMRVLVAGASGGLGGAVVERLLAEGAVVGAHCHENRARLESALSPAPDGAVRIFEANLDAAGAAHRLVEEFVGWADGIDGLVQLSGGLRRPITWSALTEEDWGRDLAVNLTGPFFLAQAAMAHMRDGGRVVLSSTASAAHGGGPSTMAYGTAKAGIEFLAKALARVGAPDGILVNAVAPGLIETPFHTERVHRTPEQIAERARLVPLGRSGTPAELAAVVLFLLSDQSSYVTGETIAVGGGDWL